MSKIAVIPARSGSKRLPKKNYKPFNSRTLVEIAENKGPKKSLVILGLSAWNTSQLDGEIELERWTLSESSMDLIFEIENNKKWLKAINNSFIRL